MGKPMLTGLSQFHRIAKEHAMKEELASLARRIPAEKRKELSAKFGRIFGAIETMTLYSMPPLAVCARTPGMALVDFRQSMTTRDLLRNPVAIAYIYSMLNPFTLIDMSAEFNEDYFGYFMQGYEMEKHNTAGPCVMC